MIRDNKIPHTPLYKRGIKRDLNKDFQVNLNKSILICVNLWLFSFFGVVQFADAKDPVCKFLEIGTSARDAAIGEIAAAVGNDAGAINRNPAGAAFIEESQLYSYYNHYFSGINHAYAAFVVRAWKLAFGGTATYFGTPEIRITDSFGNNTSSIFSQTGLASSFFLAARFVPFLSFGANVKYVREDMMKDSIDAIATDYGVMMDIYGLRLGFAYENLSDEVRYNESIFGDSTKNILSYRGESFSLPQTMRFGLGFSRWGLSIGTELSTPIEDRAVRSLDLGVGAEWWIGNVLCPRIGYRKSFDAEKGTYSAGLGLRLGPLRVDYAYVDHPQLKETHRVAMMILFGGPKEEVKVAVSSPTVVAAPPVVVISTPVAPAIVTQPVIEKPTVQINVAIAEFDAKGVSASDASTITDFVRTELVGLGYYNVMDRANMEMILTEQKFQLSGCTEQECAVKMGKLLSVKLMILGSLSKLLDTYYITVSLVDVETGKILKSVREKALTADDLSNACRKLAEELCR